MREVPEETLNHVLKRWPTWRRRIDELVETDRDFREVYQDYQELAGWIDANRGAGSERLATAIQLLESLAVEITCYLTKQLKPRSPSANGSGD